MGALTFTIKINTDWDKLSVEDAAALLERLLSWLIRALQAGETDLIVQKMCSALVAYFLKPSAACDRCMRQLTCCLSAGKFLGIESTRPPVLQPSPYVLNSPKADFRTYVGLSQFPPASEVLTTLSVLQLKAILWFSALLVEEAGKISLNHANT